MDTRDSDHAATPERFDADAVCEQCSTVNPEGTLFCKTCGNNLRDQRARRINDEGIVAVEEGPGLRSRRVLMGLLTVLGLLLVVYAAFNVSDLPDRLTDSMADRASVIVEDPSLFWTGPDALIFDEMAVMLERSPVTTDEIRMTMETPVRPGVYEGRYFITRGLLPTDPIIGTAFAVRDGNRYFFVARINDFEFRGIADTTHTAHPVSEFTGVRSPEGFLSGFGFARRHENGGLSCIGRRTDGEATHEATAFRIP